MPTDEEGMYMQGRGQPFREFKVRVLRSSSMSSMS